MKKVLVALLVVTSAVSVVLGSFLVAQSNNLTRTEDRLNYVSQSLDEANGSNKAYVKQGKEDSAKITELSYNLSVAASRTENLSNTLDQVQMSLKTVENDIQNKQTTISNLNHQITALNSSLDAATAKIDDLQTKIPKPFATKADLQNWVNSNMGLIQTAASDIGWTSVLAVQTKAISDGYLVIAVDDFDGYLLEAFVGNSQLYLITIGTTVGQLYWMD